MTRVEVKDPRELGRLMLEDAERLQMEVRYAIVDAATMGQRVVRSMEPIDTGALRRSTVVREFPNGFASIDVAHLVADAPWAVAQEVGTRPFTPPFDAILAWMQRQAPNVGLSDFRKSSRSLARDVGKAIRTLSSGKARFDRLSSKKRLGQKNAQWLKDAPLRLGAAADAVSAAERAQRNDPIYQRARAVWASIRKNGIKAKWYMRDAQPKLRVILARVVGQAVRQHKPAGAR